MIKRKTGWRTQVSHSVFVRQKPVAIVVALETSEKAKELGGEVKRASEIKVRSGGEKVKSIECNKTPLTRSRSAMLR